METQSRCLPYFLRPIVFILLVCPISVAEEPTSGPISEIPSHPPERTTKRTFKTSVSRDSNNGIKGKYVEDLATYTTLEEAELPIIDTNSTLEDYLIYAALNSPKLKAAFMKWNAAVYKIPQARSLPDPRFNYAYFIREVETRVGPQEQKVGFSQMFPWFGKLDLRENMAVETAKAVRKQYESRKLKLFYEVKFIYYEYYYLSKSIDITEENMKLLTNLEAVARSKYRAGAALSDTIQAQVELGKLDDRLKTLLDFESPLAVKFNSVLNRPLQFELPRPKSPDIEPLQVDEADLSGRLREYNPELDMLGYQQTKEKYAIDLARKDFYPDFMLGLDYVMTDNAIFPTSDSGKDPVVAMFSINLPIWRDKYKAAVSEAESRYAAIGEIRIDKENQLLADLKMAHYHFRDSERKINLFKDTLVPKAKHALSVVQKSYQSGKTDFLSLIDAERLLLEFELSYERAVANRMQRLAEMEMLIGKSMD